MIEMLLARNKKPVSKVPLIGYNFDTDTSTGKSAIAVANTTGNIIAPPVALSGYSKALKTVINGQHNITPYSPLNNILLGDFTLECWVYINYTGNTYQYVMNFPYPVGSSNSGLIIRWSDSGYGNRLQASTDPVTRDHTYGTADTKTSMSNGAFHHIAVVRRKNKLSIYVDGKARPLAVGTNGVGASTEQVSNESIHNLTGASLGFSTYSPSNLYIPEFAFWDYAKYAASFTPSVPLVKAA